MFLGRRSRSAPDGRGMRCLSPGAFITGARLAPELFCKRGKEGGGLGMKGREAKGRCPRYLSEAQSLRDSLPHEPARIRRTVYARYCPAHDFFCAADYETSTATRSCRDPGAAVIHFWLPGCVRRRPHRVMSARRDTVRPPPAAVATTDECRRYYGCCWCCCVANLVIKH